MKSARLSVAAVYVQCPHCDAFWEGTNGSHLVNQDNGYRRSQIVTCRECQQEYLLPIGLPAKAQAAVLWPN